MTFSIVESGHNLAHMLLREEKRKREREGERRRVEERERKGKDGGEGREGTEKGKGSTVSKRLKCYVQNYITSQKTVVTPIIFPHSERTRFRIVLTQFYSKHFSVKLVKEILSFIFLVMIRFEHR